MIKGLVIGVHLIRDLMEGWKGKTILSISYSYYGQSLSHSPPPIFSSLAKLQSGQVFSVWTTGPLFIRSIDQITFWIVPLSLPDFVESYLCFQIHIALEPRTPVLCTSLNSSSKFPSWRQEEKGVTEWDGLMASRLNGQELEQTPEIVRYTEAWQRNCKESDRT